MKKIILLGSGGHSKACIDVIESEKKFKIIGLVDNKKKYDSLFGYKILGNETELKFISKKTNFALIAIGHLKDNTIRENLYKKAKYFKFNYPTIISPLAYVSKHATIGAGTIVMHGSIVNAGATIAENCIINSNSLIEHDVKIESHCHISTGAIVNGGVYIKKNSFIGSGSVMKQNIIIGKNCFVNANIFLDKNLKDNSKIYEK
jgi:sugar O-acyltransferase (sialic acid O-acetyltransferase NeuD family)